MCQGRKYACLLPVGLVLFLLICHRGFADDQILMSYSVDDKDPRSVYTLELIRLIMEKTQPEYGGYQIVNNPGLTRNRALVEMLKGDRLNLREETTNTEWEKKTLAIRIPLRRGLLSYRLLLVKEQNLNYFKSITTLKQLKKASAGLMSDWVTADVLKDNGFNVVDTASYQGLFNMLNRERFMYSPRGVSEIYDEIAVQSRTYPALRIEPTLALYIPQPTYIFISPRYPGLAKRVEAGMLAMIEDGSLEALFNQHFDIAYIEKDLQQRRIFYIENKYVPDNPAAFKQSNLWLKIRPVAK